VAVLAVEVASTASELRVSSVMVRSPRVHLSDLVSGLPDGSEVDLGPAPAFDGSRFIPREEVLKALGQRGASASGSLPDGYRVRRALRVLTVPDVVTMVTAATEGILPRGASLGKVFAREVKVPDGWTEVRCTVPHPPHRTGSVSSTVTLGLYRGPDSLWVLTVPVELGLSDEAVPFDVPRGSHVNFVVRRGLVEVSSSGTVTVDADVGDVAAVAVAPSGRVLPARLEDANTAVMVDKS
jgi:hypothetical protein